MKKRKPYSPQLRNRQSIHEDRRNFSSEDAPRVIFHTLHDRNPYPRNDTYIDSSPGQGFEQVPHCRVLMGTALRVKNQYFTPNAASQIVTVSEPDILPGRREAAPSARWPTPKLFHREDRTSNWKYRKGATRFGVDRMVQCQRVEPHLIIPVASCFS